jgi:DNA-directed RNA polymerase I, II, and III subunit RPABC1
LVSVLAHKEDPTKQLFIFFPEEASVGVKTIKTYLERMGDTGASRAILVYRHNLTPPAVKTINNLASKYTIEAFAESELIVNITEHELVPKHVILKAEEKSALLAR